MYPPFVVIRATVMRNLLKTSYVYLISGGRENQFDFTSINKLIKSKFYIVLHYNLIWYREKAVTVLLADFRREVLKRCRLFRESCESSVTVCPSLAAHLPWVGQTLSSQLRVPGFVIAGFAILSLDN